jgi:hypothetical protein
MMFPEGILINGIIEGNQELVKGFYAKKYFFGGLMALGNAL